MNIGTAYLGRRTMERFRRGERRRKWAPDNPVESAGGGRRSFSCQPGAAADVYPIGGPHG